MSAIDLFESNLEIANRLPQVIDQVVGASVERINFLGVASTFAIIKKLTPLTLSRLQNGEEPGAVLGDLKDDVKKLDEEQFTPGQRTEISEKAISSINLLPQIQEIQKKLSHQAISLICTSFEAYCKDHFFELTSKEAPRNIMKIASVFEVFARDVKCLDTTKIPDVATFEVYLSSQGIDIDSVKNCFSYRHIVIHRAGIFDIKAINKLGFDNSYLGKEVPVFSLESIMKFARDFNYLARWIEVCTFPPV